MALRAQTPPQTLEGTRAELSRRLEARRDEIEAAVMNRIYAVADPSDLDPTYAEGLKAAVTAAVDYGLLAIELGEERTPSPPLILLAQARLAARAGVPLDTVLRRYFAGYALLGDFLIDEAEAGNLLRGNSLQRLLRIQAALFDRLLEAVGEEHGRGGREHPASSEQRRAERIERLLAGELVDTSSIAYGFEGWHVGAVGQGSGSLEAIDALGRGLDGRVLSIRRGREAVWAWIGGRRPLDMAAAASLAAAALPPHTRLALGEPAEGMEGWRLSHRQASAALSVALKGAEPVVRYADVALLATVLRDDLLASSLKKIYLEPLEAERDGGEAFRETLRAYFAANRNASAAAAALGANRNTVAGRLRQIEVLIGRALPHCASELEIALRAAAAKDAEAGSALDISLDSRHIA